MPAVRPRYCASATSRPCRHRQCRSPGSQRKSANCHELTSPGGRQAGNARQCMPGYCGLPGVGLGPGDNHAAEANGSRPSAKSSKASVSIRIRIFSQSVLAPQVFLLLVSGIPPRQFQPACPAVCKTPLPTSCLRGEYLQALLHQAGNAGVLRVSQPFRPHDQLGINRQVDSSFHMRIESNTELVPGAGHFTLFSLTVIVPMRYQPSGWRPSIASRTCG